MFSLASGTRLILPRGGIIIDKGLSKLYVILILFFLKDPPPTGASTLLNSGPNNRPIQIVEPEKLTKKFYTNNFCALLVDGVCIL